MDINIDGVGDVKSAIDIGKDVVTFVGEKISKKTTLLTDPPSGVKTEFVCREPLVEMMYQQTMKAVKTKGVNNKFLFSGLGGVGKTSVARALYHRLKTENKCKQIGWVECQESGNLKNGFLASINRDITAEDEEKRWEQIKTLLRDASRETILFLDSVDKYEKLLDDLTGYDATLIVTSRMPEINGYDLTLIPLLSEDECIELFRIYYNRNIEEQDESVVRELVRLVSCHTLSVELLAKSVPAKTNLKDYLNQLKEKGFGFPNLRIRTERDLEARTVSDHLKKLFDMAGLEEKQTRVMQVLALMADNRTLPFEVEDWIDCDENDLKSLTDTGWLAQTEEGYEVHPIVREIVLMDEVPLTAVEKFLDFVTYKTYFPDNYNYLAIQSKLEIVEAVLQKVGDRLEENQDTETLYISVGSIYFGQGKYVQAEGYYQKALNICLNVLKVNDQATASSYNNLGNAYSKQGKYEQAEECHRNALNIWLKVLGKDNQTTASGYNNLGIVCQNQRKYNDAEECFRNALDIRLNALGENHPKIADIYNNLGNLYRDQEKYDSAEKYYKIAQSIYRNALGENHPDIASNYNNLGNLYRDQGKYDLAKDSYEKALNINRNALGENHPDTAISYNNLGNLCKDQKDYGQAEEYYQNALDIFLEVDGKNYPVTACCYNNLGDVCYYQKKYGQAEGHYQNALSIRLKVHGENHLDTAISYHDLGVVYKCQERYDEALKQFIIAWKIFQQLLGLENSYIKTVKKNIRDCFPYIEHGNQDFESWLNHQ